MRSIVLAGVISLGFLLGACGASRQSGLCGDMDLDASATGDVAPILADAEAAWAHRGDLAQAEKAIALWEQALKIDPKSYDVRVKLSHAHYFIADSILSLKKDFEGDAAAGKAMLEHYQEGQYQAEMALGQRFPAYRTKYCARAPFNTALQQLDKDAVPAMYWYATNLGRFALATSLVEVLNQKDRIKAMMDLVHQLDPGYWYNAADRYLGAYYTKIPFPSGDLKTSAAYFQKTIDAAPQYLASKVLYAQMNLSKAGNRELFKKMLDDVIAFDLSQAPELAPENAAEQVKAKHFLADIDFMVEEE